MAVQAYDRAAFARELEREHAGSGTVDFSTIYRAISRVIPFLDPGDRRVYREESKTWHSVYRNPGAVVEFVSMDDLRPHIEALVALLSDGNGAFVPGWEAKLTLADLDAQ